MRNPLVRIHTREGFQSVGARLMTGAKREEGVSRYPFPRFVRGDGTIFGVRFSRTRDVTIDILRGDRFTVVPGTRLCFDERQEPVAKTALSIDEWISCFVEDLATDEIGIGLCTIVAVGRLHAHFEGAPLVEFVRGVIVGLVHGGAMPADDALFSPENPQGLAHFGSDTPEEIADGIVAAWVAAGMPDLEWGDWRFNSAENRAWLDEVAEEMRRDAGATKT